MYLVRTHLINLSRIVADRLIQFDAACRCADVVKPRYPVVIADTRGRYESGLGLVLLRLLLRVRSLPLQRMG